MKRHFLHVCQRCDCVCAIASSRRLTQLGKATPLPLWVCVCASERLWVIFTGWFDQCRTPRHRVNTRAATANHSRDLAAHDSTATANFEEEDQLQNTLHNMVEDTIAVPSQYYLTISVYKITLQCVNKNALSSTLTTYFLTWRHFIGLTTRLAAAPSHRSATHCCPLWYKVVLRDIILLVSILTN